MGNGLQGCSLLFQNWRMRTIVWVAMLSNNIGLFDCIFVQGLGNGNFCKGWGNPFCSVNLLVPDGLHSNETGEFTAGT